MARPCWSSDAIRTGAPGVPWRLEGPLHQEPAPPVTQEAGLPMRAAPRTRPPAPSESPAGAPARSPTRPPQEGTRATAAPKPGGRPPTADLTSSAGAWTQPSRMEVDPEPATSPEAVEPGCGPAASVRTPVRGPVRGPVRAPVRAPVPTPVAAAGTAPSAAQTARRPSARRKARGLPPRLRPRRSARGGASVRWALRPEIVSFIWSGVLGQLRQRQQRPAAAGS